MAGLQSFFVRSSHVVIASGLSSNPICAVDER